MKKLFILPLIIVTLLSFKPIAAEQKIQGICTKNRPLVRVHTETITVLDLQKRLDLALLESNPEILTNLEEKYMYYIQNWGPMLNKMINDRLITSEGEKLKIMISDCDVNEQMLARFGESPMTRLSTCNLNLTEAKAIAFEDLVVNAMSWHRVHSKTKQDITPAVLKKTYAEYQDAIEGNTELSYQFITIKAKKPEEAKELSAQIQSLLKVNQVENLDKLAELLDSSNISKNSASFNVSSHITNKKSDLSEVRVKILSSLEKLSISEPITQKPNTSEQTIRFYQLLDEKTETVPPFEKIKDSIKDKLFEIISNETMSAYISQLKEEFFFDENQLESLAQEQFTPFSSY